MNTRTRGTARALAVSTRALAALTLLGVGYAAAVTGFAQLALPAQADGSLVRDTDGTVVGSALLGQSFLDADGAPLTQFFQPRPSAAGDGYDAGASSGSNLGPEHPDLVAAVEERRAQVAALNGIDPAAVPPDALTASASGLDPHVSPAYAGLQVERVAAVRGLPAADVAALVEAHTQGRDLGFLGEPRVNVLELNLALEELEG